MQTQAHPRFKKRVPCQLDVDDERHHGMVLNVSQGGLFVSSRATPPLGSRLNLDLDPGVGSAIPIRARVIWRRKVHRSMTSARGEAGLGLEIEESSAAFGRFVSELAAGSGVDIVPSAPAPSGRSEVVAPQPDVGAEAGEEYCVRLSLPGTPRTRIVRVQALDEAAARRQALARCGADWEVLDRNV